MNYAIQTVLRLENKGQAKKLIDYLFDKEIVDTNTFVTGLPKWVDEIDNEDEFEFQINSKFKSGLYRIHCEKDWDRIGNIEFFSIEYIEENPMNIDEWLYNLNRLFERRNIIASKIDKLSDDRRNGREDSVIISKSEWIEIHDIEDNKLQNLGVY